MSENAVADLQEPREFWGVDADGEQVYSVDLTGTVEGIDPPDLLAPEIVRNRLLPQTETAPKEAASGEEKKEK